MLAPDISPVSFLQLYEYPEVKGVLKVMLPPEQKVVGPLRLTDVKTGGAFTATVTELEEEAEQPLVFETTILYVPAFLAIYL